MPIDRFITAILDRRVNPELHTKYSACHSDGSDISKRMYILGPFWNYCFNLYIYYSLYNNKKKLDPGS